MCSETWLFSCQNFCGDGRAKASLDLTELCFEGDTPRCDGLGVPMFLLYVIGFPVGAPLWYGDCIAAPCARIRLHEMKGIPPGGSYRLRDETCGGWHGSLGKVGVAMIGVFGAAMGEMQVLLTPY